MTKTFCDRCGNLIKAPAVVVNVEVDIRRRDPISGDLKGSAGTTYTDTCDSCYDEFESIIEDFRNYPKISNVE